MLRATGRFPEQSAGELPAAPERAGVGLNEYDRNIQTADLNSLNAVLAVINWKKYLGYYADHTAVLETVYKIYTGEIRNAVTES